MESEKKIKNTSANTSPRDSVIRALKYEPDSDSCSFPIRFQGSSNKQDKKLKDTIKKENRSFEEEDIDSSASKLPNTVLYTSASQRPITHTNIKQEENSIFIKDKKGAGRADSSFNEFCKGLQLSPVANRTKAPLDFTRHVSYDNSKPKNHSTHSHKSLIKSKASNSGANPAKKNISKLDLNNRLVFIRSIRDEINIQLGDSGKNDEDDKSDDNLSMHCSEGHLDIDSSSKDPNIEYDTNINMKTDSPRSNKQASNKYFQQYDFLENAKTNFETENFGADMINELEADGTTRITNENSSTSQSITLASLNSFFGKKSHHEKVPLAKVTAFDANNNDINQHSNTNPHGKEIFGLGSEQKDQKKKIICNCKKSKCLKLYCDCFAAGEPCGPECNCNDCCNHEDHEERNAAIQSTIERNPTAFKPKVDKIDSPTQKIFGDTTTAPRHNKGCNCKKSGCLKKYCECYQAGIKCSDMCKCEACKNMDPVVAMKRSRTPGFSQETFSMNFENSQSSFLDSMHGHSHFKHRFFSRRGLKGLEDDIFDETLDKDPDEAEEEEMGRLQKKLSIECFNSYQTSTLLDEIMSPSKATTKLDQIIGIKVKTEEANSSKKEEASSKSERKRKKPQSEKKVKV